MTKGSGLNINGSTMKLIRWKRRGTSRIVTRSHMMVIDQRVSDHVCCFTNRRVSRLRVFNALRIDSGSPEKYERTPKTFRRGVGKSSEVPNCSESYLNMF